ncbi:DNA cytosine methyltransferase [cf. Phormidesmis sp. LEGE 11477]|uniref:DNA cytosine methyltransferase n=1 Tax=cf. Phormidesmis sp. LEGE 11477 TaxID=1828680 RepID=UPI00187EE6DC|nr:DNA (cytosine-5-)-methyltransferase [cf. Phormidesmis sp. LEGE 11477]MBE9061936.1 DNA (cytosine-5-)-methyltransferase [cf. Phormidesmis sp. LEGE 11477]
MLASTARPSVLSSDTVGQTSSYRTCAEYFAGIGLVRLGLERAGWNIIFANDWAREKFDMYAAYFQEAEDHYTLENVFDLCQANVPPSLLATASFPCIDLSLAGNQNGLSGHHSSAFWGFIEALKRQQSRPPLVMLENVGGWLTSNQGKDFRLTIEALNRLGYACDVFAVDAARFVPQSRLRVFVVGVQTAEPSDDLLTLARRPTSLKTKSLDRAIASNQDLLWNFLNIPPLPDGLARPLDSIVEDISEVDERWWAASEVERHLQMMSAINIAHIDELQQRCGYSYRTMYRRVRSGQQRAELRKDNIAGCLRTARGGSSRQMLVRVGPDGIRMRMMTPREYARLQGVPDDYPLPKNINQALTGFGDAVCVPVVTWIGENILNPLAATLL